MLSRKPTPLAAFSWLAIVYLGSACAQILGVGDLPPPPPESPTTGRGGSAASTSSEQHPFGGSEVFIGGARPGSSSGGGAFGGSGSGGGASGNPAFAASGGSTQTSGGAEGKGEAGGSPAAEKSTAGGNGGQFAVYDVTADLVLTSPPVASTAALSKTPWKLGEANGVPVEAEVPTSIALVKAMTPTAVDQNVCAICKGISEWNSPKTAGSDSSLGTTALLNGSANFFSVNSVVIPPHTLALAPGMSNEYAMVSWTAPRDGHAAVEAHFTALDSTAVGVIVALRGAPQFTSTVLSYGETKDYTNTFEVRAGDTIEFAVGGGPSSFMDLNVMKLEALIRLAP